MFCNGRLVGVLSIVVGLRVALLVMLTEVLLASEELLAVRAFHGLGSVSFLWDLDEVFIGC